LERSANARQQARSGVQTAASQARGDDGSGLQLKQALQQARMQQAPLLKSLQALLDSCWNLLQEGEVTLHTQGFQTANVCRLLLERTKTAVAALYIGAAEYELSCETADLPADIGRRIEIYSEIARSSLQALQAASQGQPFWQKIVLRQDQRLLEVLQHLEAARNVISVTHGPQLHS
jgi:hypothetical protein